MALKTAATRDWKDGGSADADVPLNSLLGRVVWLAGWATPTAQDHSRGGLPPRPHDTGVPLSQMVALASGPTPTGSPAATGKPGQLNPAFSLWLMGYPPEWGSCAPLATRSSRKLPPRS
jgi:hypothetical protein